MEYRRTRECEQKKDGITSPTCETRTDRDPKTHPGIDPPSWYNGKTKFGTSMEIKAKRRQREVKDKGG